MPHDLLHWYRLEMFLALQHYHLTVLHERLRHDFVNELRCQLIQVILAILRGLEGILFGFGLEVRFQLDGYSENGNPIPLAC